MTSLLILKTPGNARVRTLFSLTHLTSPLPRQHHYYPSCPFFFVFLETSINRCLRSHRRASPAGTPLLFGMAYLPSLMWTLRKKGFFFWFFFTFIKSGWHQVVLTAPNPPSQNPPPSSLLSAIIWSPGWQLLPFIPFHGPPPEFKWHALFRGVALMI